MLFGGTINDGSTSFYDTTHMMKTPVGDTWIFNGVEETWKYLIPTNDEQHQVLDTTTVQPLSTMLSVLAIAAVGDDLWRSKEQT